VTVKVKASVMRVPRLSFRGERAESPEPMNTSEKERRLGPAF
jgi:hypothetical protein